MSKKSDESAKDSVKSDQHFAGDDLNERIVQKKRDELNKLFRKRMNVSTY